MCLYVAGIIKVMKYQKQLWAHLRLVNIEGASYINTFENILLYRLYVLPLPLVAFVL
jgi:hypothetical protein